jgi:hypothetical protein
MRKFFFVAIIILFSGCKKEMISPKEEKEKSILFMGDSQMVCEGGTYDIFCKKYPSIKAHRIALSGQTSEWVLDTLKKYNGNYTDLVIIIGTNDAYLYSEISASYKNIGEIIRIAKFKMKANVIMYTVPPTARFHGWNEHTYQNTIALNNFIRNYPGIKVIDDYTLLNYNKGMLPPYTYTHVPDAGIHISPLGHRLCFPVLEEVLGISY